MTYTGSSLLSVPGKLLTGLFARKIGDFLEKGNFPPNEQNGFHPESYAENIFTLCDLRTRKARNEETFCALVDFQKASNLLTMMC